MMGAIKPNERGLECGVSTIRGGEDGEKLPSSTALYG